MPLSKKAMRQMRLTLALGEFKSELIAFFNAYDEALQGRHDIGGVQFIAADNLLNIIFREHFASDERERRLAEKLILDVLDLPATLALPDIGDHRERLNDLASQELPDSTRAWFREILDQLADIPERIRGEAQGRYVRKYALRVAKDFEQRLRETRVALNV